MVSWFGQDCVANSDSLWSLRVFFVIENNNPFESLRRFLAEINPGKSSVIKRQIWAVVVAQLAKRSLPTPEIRRSNPVTGKTLYNCLSTVFQF